MAELVSLRVLSDLLQNYLLGILRTCPKFSGRFTFTKRKGLNVVAVSLNPYGPWEFGSVSEGQGIVSRAVSSPLALSQDQPGSAAGPTAPCDARSPCPLLLVSCGPAILGVTAEMPGPGGRVCQQAHAASWGSWGSHGECELCSFSRMSPACFAGSFSASSRMAWHQTPSLTRL